MSESTTGGETKFLDRDHYEALVIGSGFGGAVAVCRLAHPPKPSLLTTGQSPCSTVMTTFPTFCPVSTYRYASTISARG
jgi:hypothetical protein